MKLDPAAVVPPLAAVVILTLILTQTQEALRLSGAWRKASAAAAAAPSPFARLEQLLAAPRAPLATLARNPLGGALTSAPVAMARTTRPTTPTRPAPPPVPTLTSIIFDADPRATLRWQGRDYSVRPNGLFADFRVLSIGSEQVVLEHQGESLVLRLPKRGE